MQYEVNVCRIGYAHRTILVEAKNEEEAKDIAVDKAGDYEFSEHSSDYEAQEVNVKIGA